METFICWLQNVSAWLESHNGAITAIATAFMAVFTWRLWVSTNKLWEEAKNSGVTASTAANAAKKSAKIAGNALIVGQRAFVSESTIEHAPTVKSTKTGEIITWDFTPIWTNNGDTPTRNMVNHVNCHVFDKKISPDWDFPDLWNANIPRNERIPVPLGISPKSFIRGQTVNVPVDIIADVISGKKFLYFWGWATYNDVFPKTEKHVTRFAVQIIIGGDARNINNISFNFPFLQEYNCSDEECEYQKYPANWEPRLMEVE